MALKIRQGSWDHFDKKLQRRLLGLTLRGPSGMRDEVYKIKYNYIDHKVFVLFQDETPMAWAIAAYDDYDEEYDLMVYTRRGYRRRGYGRKLIWKARRWAERKGRISFFPDPDNERFWLSMFGIDVVEIMKGAK